MDIFRNMHPITVAVYFLTVSVLAMFIQNPVIYVLALLGGIAMQSFVTGGRLSLWLLVIAPFGIALTNPLVSHLGSTVLLKVGMFKITLESILFGLCAGVMLAAVMMWFGCMGKVLGSDKTIYLFGRWLPRMALTLTIALRFIPLMLESMNRIKRTQTAMGMYCCKSKKERIKSAGGTLVTLIALSVENAMETASAMNARGYGLKGRTCLIKYRFGVRDIIIILLSLFLASVVIYASAVGGLEFEFYPVIITADVNAVNIAAYVSYGLLVMLTPIIKLTEEAKWNYCVSKI